MMGRTYLAALAALVVCATNASAQQHVASEFSLGFGNVSGGVDTNLTLMGIKSDWSFGGNFGLQGDFNFSQSGTGTTTSGFVLHGYREFGSGLRAGLYVGQENLGIEAAPISPRFNSYGVEVLLPLTDRARIEAFVGQTDYQELPVPVGGHKSYGVKASYDFNDRLRAHMRYQLDDLDAGLPVGNTSQYAIGIDYVSDGFGLGVPLVLSAEYGGVSLPLGGGDDLDVVKLTVTIPIGGADQPRRVLFGDRKATATFAYSN